MNITYKNTSIRRIRDDIHAAEAAIKAGTWRTYAAAKGLYVWNHREHVTGLYTLRAWMRGQRLHRTNPPAKIRDFNRSMLESGRPSEVVEWDAVAHNRAIAESVAERYRIEPAVLDPNRSEAVTARALCAAAADKLGASAAVIVDDDMIEISATG